MPINPKASDIEILEALRDRMIDNQMRCPLPEVALALQGVKSALFWLRNELGRPLDLRSGMSADNAQSAIAEPAQWA